MEPVETVLPRLYDRAIVGEETVRIPEMTVMLLNVADNSKPPVWTP